MSSPSGRVEAGREEGWEARGILGHQHLRGSSLRIKSKY